MKNHLVNITFTKKGTEYCHAQISKIFEAEKKCMKRGDS